MQKKLIKSEHYVASSKPMTSQMTLITLPSAVVFEITKSSDSSMVAGRCLLRSPTAPKIPLDFLLNSRIINLVNKQKINQNKES